MLRFVLLINVNLLTVPYSLLLKHSWAWKFFSANKYENANYVGFFNLLAEKILCSAELSMKKSFITSGPDLKVEMIQKMA